MTGHRLLFVFAVVAVVAVAPVAAHGNTIAVDAQATADGTVRIELVSLAVDGYVILHADDDGSPGVVVGHQSLGGLLDHDVVVSIDSTFWTNQRGNVTLWAVLHREETGDGFAADDDPPQANAQGDIVQEAFVVQKRTDGSINLLAEREPVEETNTSAVTVSRAELAQPGFVVVRADDDGSPGRIVGQTFLEPGTHHDVAVDVAGDFYREQPERFHVWAQAYRDDGDGRFAAAVDRPVLVAGQPVRTRFSVKRTGEPHGHEHEHEGSTHETPTATVTPKSTASPTLATTATPSPTAASTPSSTPQPTTELSTPMATGAQGPDTVSPTTSVQTPGFGLAVAILALVATALLARRRGSH